jgi:epoxyqueuosine reductase
MLQEIVQNSLANSGNFIVGYAAMKGLVADCDLPFGVVIGKQLDDKIIDPIAEGPTLDYYHHYREVNSELSGIIHNIADIITRNGYGCRIVEPSVGKGSKKDEYNEESLRTPVSHKMIATRSGLGWIGKTDLFISKKFGPRLRLVSLLTDYPVDSVGLPIEKSRCGSCDTCVISCPVNAATGRLWDIQTDRDLFFDAHKCEKNCIEVSKSRLNLDATICGICVAVCPLGKQNRTA